MVTVMNAQSTYVMVNQSPPTVSYTVHELYIHDVHGGKQRS